MSTDIGNGKRLLTKQHFHPDFGLLVLVQPRLPFTGSDPLDD